MSSSLSMSMSSSVPNGTTVRRPSVQGSANQEEKFLCGGSSSSSSSRSSSGGSYLLTDPKPLFVPSSSFGPQPCGDDRTSTRKCTSNDPGRHCGVVDNRVDGGSECKAHAAPAVAEPSTERKIAHHGNSGRGQGTKCGFGLNNGGGVGEDGCAKSRTAHNKVKKKWTWKKPEGKPKRPLSAYNYFFQHERQKIVDRARLSMEQSAGEDEDGGHGVDVNEDGDDGDDGPDDIATATTYAGCPPHAKRQRQRKDGGGRSVRRREGKIGFQDLAKTIAERWSSLDDDYRSLFEEMANIDKQRYEKELSAWRMQQGDTKTGRKKGGRKTTTTCGGGSGGGSRSRLFAHQQDHSRQTCQDGSHLQSHSQKAQDRQTCANSQEEGEYNLRTSGTSLVPTTGAPVAVTSLGLSSDGVKTASASASASAKAANYPPSASATEADYPPSVSATKTSREHPHLVDYQQAFHGGCGGGGGTYHPFARSAAFPPISQQLLGNHHHHQHLSPSPFLFKRQLFGPSYTSTMISNNYNKLLDLYCGANFAGIGTHVPADHITGVAGAGGSSGGGGPAPEGDMLSYLAKEREMSRNGNDRVLRAMLRMGELGMWPPSPTFLPTQHRHHHSSQLGGGGGNGSAAAAVAAASYSPSLRALLLERHIAL